jgi:hypothetical protein
MSTHYCSGVQHTGTSQRRAGDGGADRGVPQAAARPERGWRLWPPEISWSGFDTVAARGRGAAARLAPRALWRDHRLFTVAACLSLLPRVVAALGFRPALLIQDSFSYLGQGVHPFPLGQTRPEGYPLLLRVLEPFHSLLLVTTLQHLMGIGLAVVIYAVLRSRGLPAWGATLAAAPTLFDSRQIWLESSILPDTLFMLVLMIAVVLLLRPRPAVWQALIAGVLVSWASVIRGNGAPVFVVILAFLLIMRVGWRVVAACVTAFAVPLLGYMLVFHAEHGELNITSSGGLFLWSRTMSFANCAVINPPADLRPLCPQAQPDHPTSPAPPWSVPALLGERTPAAYLWAPGAWYQHDAHPGINGYNDKLATSFAIRAIEAQPLDYARTVGKEVMLTFLATDRSQSYLSLHFTVAPHVAALAHWMWHNEDLYAHTRSNTHVVQPWAYLMFLYQEPVWFPGIVFLGVMLGGLVLLIRRWRGWGRYAAPAWGVAVVNLVLPIAAHELDYRYAISAVPFACLALALTFIRRPAPQAADQGDPLPVVRGRADEADEDGDGGEDHRSF